jgi:hypothetical protein
MALPEYFGQDPICDGGVEDNASEPGAAALIFLLFDDGAARRRLHFFGRETLPNWLDYIFTVR